MNQPQYNRCDHCGRNAHKVAVRIPAGKVAPRSTKVVGYCPGCFESCLVPTTWNPTPFATAKLVYDRRGEATKARVPVPEHML